MALAGGGALGAIYEIGALAALAEALDGLDFNDADVYVGVSAGGFIAAGLANGFTPHEMSRLFIEGDKSRDRFEPSMLLRPAFGEYARRIAKLPLLLAGAFSGGTFARLSRALPAGIFSSCQVDEYLSRIFSEGGRSNDFRRLKRKLYVVATDLDSGESAVFGAPGMDHVPISRAVQASAALPGLFPPVAIDNRYFVDGALNKTLHASLALDEGVDLLICLNPLVPYDARRARSHPLNALVDGGLPVVLGQTFRTIIHSRMNAGFERYKAAYPQADIVLFEPARADSDMFFTNLFSYSSRRRLTEHAYQQTREQLRQRRDELAPILAQHGVELRDDVLRDKSATLVKSLGKRREPQRMLTNTLDELERWMQLQAA